MSKIICDICGTTYQDISECCPICGCARGAAADLLGEEIQDDIAEEIRGTAVGVLPKKKRIFDYDEVNTLNNDETSEVEVEDDSYDEDEQAYDDGSHHNVFVVILLTVLIAALLIAAGFIFIRYFLPNMGGEEETVPATTVAQAVEETTATTELRIPCDTLFLNSSKQAELNQPGFSHLINVVVFPEDTTDELTFVSADESIATVSEDGKITAISEGETTVTITCGDIQMYVTVVCDFTPETEPTTEATEATVEDDETVAENNAETNNEGTKEVNPNITLKLKQFDIRLGVYYQFRMELDCDLDPKDVEWYSEHPYIAKVDEEGVVTAVKAGTTAIIAKYGDQKVQCIVRCG